MKSRISRIAIAVIVAGTFFAAGAAFARIAGLSKGTSDNLSTAMHGEAFAYAKYMLFAEHARKSGDEQLAKLFEESAKTERFEHFAEEANLAGVVGTDAENLKSAINGESYEVDTMYREFAKKAAAAGDKSAADLFEEIRQDEMKHRDAFKVALAKLDKTSQSGM